MKKTIIATILVAVFAVLALSTEDSPAALSVVNKRMAAYNAHDLPNFLATYADDVKVYTYPGRLLTDGKDGIQSIFAPMFEEGKVKVTIHHQIAKDSFVINHETVEYPNGPIGYVSIYKVEGGLITDVRFVRD